MFNDNMRRMNSMSDRDVAWVATVISQMRYTGNCACPDNRDDAQNLCGNRSAYSRGGGIWCYASDVPLAVLPATRQMAANYALPVECGGIGATGLLTFDK